MFQFWGTLILTKTLKAWIMALKTAAVQEIKFAFLWPYIFLFLDFIQAVLMSVLVII